MMMHGLANFKFTGFCRTWTSTPCSEQSI